MHVLALMIAFAAAKSVEFTPQIHVFDCPKGAHYPVMECNDFATELPRQTVTFDDAGDGFWVGTFDGTSAQGPLQAFGELSFLRFPHQDGRVFMQLTISVGFENDALRNPGGFFEAEPSQFPSWYMVTGEKRSLDNGREAWSEIEYSDLVVHDD